MEVPRVDYDKLLNLSQGESSTVVQARVERARERQLNRLADYPGLFTNADMGASHVQQLCVLASDAKQLLDVSVRRMKLSARAYHRVLKLSRTIADLDDKEVIEVHHVAEAVQYRSHQAAVG